MPNMKTPKVVMLVLLLTAAARAQIDNRYCTAENTWAGTNAANPAIFDGPASLPTACFNTDPRNTPSPGPVVTVNPTQSLQAAYNAAACGTTIRLTSGGVWDDPFTFPAKGCDDQHWITIMSDGNLPPPGYRIAPSFIPQMAQLRIAKTSGLLSVGDHLHFIGIYWQKNTARGGILYFFAQSKGSYKVIFDRNLFRGKDREETQHGVVINTGRYIAVIDSWLDKFQCIAYSCTDSQAISGGTGAAGEDITASGPVKIVNNYVEASTENVMFGGAQANGPGPQDVEIRRNYLYKPMSWNPAAPNYQGDPHYIVKNCLELKNGIRVLVEGNICENNWGGFSQDGYAILLTPKNQAKSGTLGLCPLCMVADITIRYNYIHTASGAFMISSGRNGTGTQGQYSMGQHRTSIHDNVADNLQYGAACYGCGYMLMQLGSSYAAGNPPPDGGVMNDISIDHNTILASGENPSSNKWQARALISIIGVPPSVDTPQASNISFQDNIASSMSAGLYSAGGGADNCATVAKPQTPVNIWTGCFTGTSPFAGNVLIAYPSPVTNWPSGNLFAPSMTTVGFYDYDNRVYAVPQNSPYLGKGAHLDVVTQAVFGVREEALEAPAKGKKPSAPSHPPTEPQPAEHPTGWGLGFFSGMVLGLGLGIILALVYVLVKRPR